METSHESVASGNEPGHEIAAIAEATRALLQNRKRLSRLLIDSARIVETFRAAQGWSESKIAAWLENDVGMAGTEASTLLGISPVLMEHAEEISNNPLQLPVLQVLAGSDEATRSELFGRLSAGEAVDVEFVRKLASKNFGLKLPTDEAADLRRRRRMVDASVVAGPALVTALERRASELLNLFDDIADQLLDEDTDREPDEEDIEYQKAGALIADRAAELRRLFEILFGDAHASLASIVDLSVADDVDASLAFAWHALRRLESEWMELWEISPYSSRLGSLRPAIEFLAGRRPVATPISTDRSPKRSPTRQLTFLDFGAGVGCSALGLCGAGFEPVAIYESSLKPRETISANRQDWKVKEEPSSEELAEYRSRAVDLLTAGPAWKPFNSPRDRNPFNRALEITGAVLPKAFFFEMHPAMIKSSSDEYRREIRNEFHDLGYDVQWHSLVPSQFGLAQLKNIEILVGTRQGLNRPSMPIILDPPLRFLTDVIGDLVEARTAFDFGDDEGAKRYKDWADLCDRKLAPSFFTMGGNRNTPEWGRLGIDYSLNRPGEQPPGLIPLTIEMMRRIQGYPRAWILDGRTEEQEFDVASSLPPIVAKMIGLSIYATLTGEELDHRASLDEPLPVRTPRNSPMVRGRFGGYFAARRGAERRRLAHRNEEIIKLKDAWIDEFGLERAEDGDTR
ncbi:DNA cytosine methyltransferase [Rhizobium ruizarguesonis]